MPKLFPPSESNFPRGRRHTDLFPLMASATVALGLMGSAHAASNVSPNFDGSYSGTARATAWRDHEPCADFEIKGLQIRKGFVNYGAVQDAPRITGFITAEGYFTSTLTLLGGARVPLDGRLSDGRLVAGAIDETSSCAWLLELTPTD